YASANEQLCDALAITDRFPSRQNCLKNASFYLAFSQQALPTPVRLYSVLRQLGNYLGALSNWVKVQKTTETADTLLFSIVGWHALTLPQDPATLRSD
ncbi:hypothetical protein EV401DRAFT_2005067, partial [Pisolithus croceorrhizus]